MNKTILLFFLAVMLFSCTTGKHTVASWDSSTVKTPCPPETECLFEAMKDKSLLVRTDDTGHTYYNLKDTPGKTVLKYTYRKITDAQLADAGYNETIIFETDGSSADLNYTGTAIQKIKMLFSVSCFCRGKAGVYKVEDGTLSYANKKLHIEIPKIVDGQMTRVVDVIVR